MTALLRNQERTSQPPYTNRGVRDTQKFYDAVFSLDWLRITVWTDYKGIQPLLEIYGVADEIEPTGYGGIGFSVIYQASNGFQLYTEPKNAPMPYVSLNLPSKCIQSIGLDAIVEGHEWLCGNGLEGLRWNCTRLDIAFDTQLFSSSDFEQAYHDGQISTVARSWSSIRGSDDGHTFYLGSRQSTAMLRCYHKMDGHSFGDGVPFTRVELELKADRAELAIFEVLQGNFNDMPGLAANILTGFITVQTSWWSKFMVDVKSAWVRLQKHIPTVESIKNWLYSQVATSFVTFIGAVSGANQQKINGEINKLITQGKKGLTAKHYAMMRNYQENTATQFVGGF